MPEIAGATPRVARAGYKDWDRCDLTYVVLDEGTTVAGVTTQNLCCSAEIELCRAHLPHGRARALVVNAGNSNAFTGQRGKDAVDVITKQVAAQLNCEETEIFVSSTGVIGVPLPVDKAQAGLRAAFDAAPCSWEDVTHAIGTTDTFAKGATASAIVDGRKIQIVGIIKGSGMIAPDMATMLVYIFTDAKISATALQKILSRNTDATFNSITVDSDTSTSDTLLLAATGQSDAAPLKGATLKAFEVALTGVMLNLAHQVIRDGEGATKFVEVNVTGAATDSDAHRVALAIANSPLVKTAIAGQDPNWGRIVAAIGKSGAAAERDRLTIKFGDIVVARKGWRNPKYREEDGATYMQQPELVISVDMGLGRGKRKVWTCDLTNRYVEINADYRS